MATWWSRIRCRVVLAAVLATFSPGAAGAGRIESWLWNATRFRSQAERLGEESEAVGIPISAFDIAEGSGVSLQISRHLSGPENATTSFSLLFTQGFQRGGSEVPCRRVDSGRRQGEEREAERREPLWRSKAVC